MALEIQITECLVDFIGVYSPLDSKSVVKESLKKLIGKPVYVQSGWMNDCWMDIGQWMMIFREETSPQKEFLFAPESDFLWLKRCSKLPNPVRRKNSKSSSEN